MKLWVKFVALVLVICLLCACFSGCRSDDTKENKTETITINTKKIDKLAEEINANLEVKTYKNTLALYEELILLDPDNIDWYVGLAEAYGFLGHTSKYKRACQEIIKLFPNNRIGYLMLIKFYAAKDRDKKVIATYNQAPELVKTDEEFLSIYQESEWVYRFRDSRYDSISVFGNDRYVTERRGLYGYKKKNFAGGISAKFDQARPFIEDYAAVNKDNEWYFIDTAGYRVLATTDELEDLCSMSEGFAVAKINGKYGYIDSSFNQYSFEYQDATSFYNGVAAVKKDGKWALINKNFNEITPFIYDNVIRDDANICSREGIVFLHANGVYHMLDSQGNVVTSDVFNDANLFYSDYAAVKKGNKWGFVDKNGKTIVDFVYEDASSYASDIFAVKQNGKWGCITKTDKVVLPFLYDDAVVTADNGVVVVKIKDVYRFVQFTKFTVA